jgi:hypothetical protein
VALRDGDKEDRLKATVVQTLSAAPDRDSGGPLLDNRGYQVGVAVHNFRGGALNVGEYIDVTEIRAFLDTNKVKVADPPPRKPLTRELLTKDPKK